MNEEEMIADILKHLDSETKLGAARMSVEMGAGQAGSKEVSHKCCNAYGRPASETVGLLDMYTDISAPKMDEE
ncbi:MAG: hypothetical protein Q4C58_06640 [Eubacteriales bacterium]|nr:hypothetical protein [Eubacteriales bacterium]